MNPTNSIEESHKGMTLQTLSFPPSLDTSSDEIARQFYLPALRHAVRYERAVGYFTAQWFRVNAAGMAEFVVHGGRARWIISPVLTPDDAKALEEGYERVKDRVLLESLNRSIQDWEQYLSEETRSALAWLIADGALDFRIALPCGKLEGDFHAKFGIFYDDEGYAVAFDGSQNDTARGFENYESIKLFWNWDPALAVYVESDMHRFARLWNDRDLNVRVHTVPEAIRQRLLQLRTLPRPYALQGDGGAGYVKEKRPPTYSRLWAHQEQAVAAWLAADRRGILVMATGTGKTRTALNALSQVAPLRLVVIAVPRNELVNQWHEVVTSGLSSDVRLLRIAETSYDWFDRAYRLLTLTQTGYVKGPVAFVGTYQSLSGQKFQGLLTRVGVPEKDSLLIADEVHNAGAPTFQRLLLPGFAMRLGLTATLERELDPEGTQRLKDYFGEVVFQFGLDEAIKAGVLSPYRYYPLFARLSDEELEEYEYLTERIARLGGQTEGGEEGLSSSTTSQELEHLYFMRARIFKKCHDKKRVLSELLDQVQLKKSLIYCADLEQVSEAEQLLRKKSIPWMRFSSLENADTRRRALDLLSRGHVQVLVSVNCLDEGVDIPDVREAILIASSESPRQFVQRRGRLLRKSVEKSEAVLYDILATPPPLSRYYRSPMLARELRRATLIARAAINGNQAQASLLKILQPLGVNASDVL